MIIRVAPGWILPQLEEFHWSNNCLHTTENGAHILFLPPSFPPSLLSFLHSFFLLSSCLSLLLEVSHFWYRDHLNNKRWNKREYWKTFKRLNKIYDTISEVRTINVLACHNIDFTGCSYLLQQLCAGYKNYVWVIWSLSCIWFLFLMNHIAYLHWVTVNFCILFIATEEERQLHPEGW